MPSFGEMLRQERKARKIRVRDVAESTKISSIYLRALEANEFDQLPGTVFNKGYVKAYADYLGVDAGPLISAYEREEKAQSGESEAGPPPPRPAEGRGRMLALAAAALVILAGAAVAVTIWLRSPEDDGAPAAISTPRQASVARSSGPADGGEAVPPEAPPEIAPPPQPQPGPPMEAAAAEPKGGTPAGTGSAPVKGDGPPPEARSPRQTTPEGREGGTVSAPAASATAAASGETSPAPVREQGGGPGPRVVEHAVGSRVESHSLQGETDTFREGARAYFWTRVVGAEPGQILRHVWMREGAEVSRVEMELGSTDWRAHSYKTLFPGSAGSWTVEARDDGGRVLARASFTCLP